MSSDSLASQAIDLLLKANRMFKDQAEERQLIYQKLIQTTTSANENNKRLERVQKELKATSNSDYIKKQKLDYLNSQILELEQREQYRDELLTEIKRQEANKKSRDELIGILEEYIDIEEAKIYALVRDYSEAQEAVQEMESQGKTFELLSKNDPRMKAIEAIQSHPEGISIVQLSFMLGTTQYRANKIINELLELGLIERHNMLLKFVDSNHNFADLSLLNLTV